MSHPNNIHQTGYNLTKLAEQHLSLRPFITLNPSGEKTIDFSDQKAVYELNRALLQVDYELEHWSIPEPNLCPPVPSRANYIHYLADLLFESTKLEKKNSKIKGLDLGTGANCIYPLLGTQIYDWKFVGSEKNTTSIQSAKRLIEQNPKLVSKIKIRKQKSENQFFRTIINANERFDFTMCNPPFFTSQEEAEEVNAKKSKNLGRKAAFNFGGLAHELWIEGGELTFIKNMISESVQFQSKVLWFTCLVSKSEYLEPIEKMLSKNKRIQQHRQIDMHIGQKKTRFIAWTFQTKRQLHEWKRKW
ncbi:MAG: 23S rRNA (adenine(1618)-N(6))-methyltransferase RlmF [Flavobacteriales bacterium]